MRIALITGAGRGIGREIAIAAAHEDIHVILVARSENEIKNVAEEINSFGGKAAAFTCDITDPKSVTSLYAETQSIGIVDILINNAGIAPSAKIENTDDELWENAFATNVDGAFFLIRTYLPDMKSNESGQIINIASTAAIEGFPYTAAYTASKHALIGLSRAIAKEISRFNIKVSTICPGFVRTNIFESGISNITNRTGKSREEAESQLAAMNKSGKIIEPVEIAQAVLKEINAPLDSNGREIIL
jgi:NAD(P)-dependent dehydrogenase (short-subunit alcohol dehydrogenase family)